MVKILSLYLNHYYNFTFRGKYYAYAYMHISSKIYQNILLSISENNGRQSVCPTINKAL